MGSKRPNPGVAPSPPQPGAGGSTEAAPRSSARRMVTRCSWTDQRPALAPRQLFRGQTQPCEQLIRSPEGPASKRRRLESLCRCYTGLWAGSWPSGPRGSAPSPAGPSLARAGHPDAGRGLVPTWSQMSSHFFSLSYWLSSCTLSGGKFMQFWGGEDKVMTRSLGPQRETQDRGISSGATRGQLPGRSVTHMNPCHPLSLGDK